ncbi:hypothetical protein F5I97DRAFT_1977520 [Phlebopus sp. FC_14]|nr:hypothetical protein F5I97DRAFT_1977520 [Phlebopus sp. FC_14]
MELLPPNARRQVRRVQNIDIIYTDLSCLAIGGQKIPGAVINAFGILLQEKDDNTADYAILSSYLAPIITQGSTSYGTLEEHILAAVLDIYKKGANSRYGSVDSADSLSDVAFLSLHVYLSLSSENSDETVYEDDDPEDSLPRFSMRYHSYHLHTHAPVHHALYHLGQTAFQGSDQRALQLTPEAGKHWRALTQPTVKQKLLKLRIGGGKVTIV